jgi:transporter family-2 protein
MKKTYLLAVLLALSAGAALPLQAMLNARLGRSLGAPSWGGFVSAGVSALVLLAFSYVNAGAPALAQSARELHPGVWLGGVLGALYIFAAVYCAKTMGAAGMVACMLLGQLFGALALDWSGWLAAPVPITWKRIVGCSLAAAGVLLATLRS